MTRKTIAAKCCERFLQKKLKKIQQAYDHLLKSKNSEVARARFSVLLDEVSAFGKAYSILLKRGQEDSTIMEELNEYREYFDEYATMLNTAGAFWQEMERGVVMQ